MSQLTEDEQGFEMLRRMKAIFGSSGYTHVRPLTGQYLLDCNRCSMGCKLNWQYGRHWYGFNWEDCWNNFLLNKPTISNIVIARQLGYPSIGEWFSINTDKENYAI